MENLFAVLFFILLWGGFVASLLLWLKSRWLVFKIGQFEYTKIYSSFKYYSIVHEVKPVMNDKNELLYILVEIDRRQLNFDLFYTWLKSNKPSLKTLVIV